MANYYDLSSSYDKIRIKFSAIPKLSAMTNANFILYENAATPVETSFYNLDLSNDYDTVGRILTLRLATLLKSNTSYRLSVENLLDTVDRSIATEYFDFTTGIVSNIALSPPVQETVAIRDRSIRSHAFLTGNTILSSNPDFYIVSTNPENQDVFVPDDLNNGRIVLVFSRQPRLSMINNQYFKAQRKKVQRSPARWETLNTQVSLDTDNPWVYIDFPSDEETPVFNVEGHTYFSQGYKYRVKVSKTVSI